MHFVLLENIFANEITRAVCRTFLYSLWQGLLLVILANVFLSLSKRSKPAVRYNFLAALFIFFILLTCYTFSGQFAFATAAEKKLQESSFGVSSTGVSVVNLQFLINRILNYLDTYTSWIIIIWFMIFGWKIVQLIRNLEYIRHVRRNNVSYPSEYWNNKVKEFAHLLQIQKPVLLLESGIVKLPAVIGFLKPVVLVPVALLSNLSLQHAEAILLHELAHVRRRDYLINLLQNVTEKIFFFNPALLWLSSRMREERENCCDEMAISITGDKMSFVNALLSFQEYSAVENKYALAFPGKKNHLLNRVSKILRYGDATPIGLGKIFLLIAFISAGFFVMSFYDGPARLYSNTSHVTEMKLKPVAENENKTEIIGDKTFFDQDNSNVPGKSRRPIKKSFGEKVFEHNKNVMGSDTIPKNASKEFIAGYMAAINFRNSGYSTDDEKEKNGIERSLQNNNTLGNYDSIKTEDAAMKKQVEEKMRMTRRIQ